MRGDPRQAVSSERRQFNIEHKISVAVRRLVNTSWQEPKTNKNSRRKDQSHFHRSSQGKDPRGQGSSRLDESSGALSHEEAKLMVRCTSEGTQSQERKKEKRWWERWRDKANKKEGKWRRRRKRSKEGRKEGSEEGQEAVEGGKEGWNLENIGTLLFLFLLVTRNFGVANAASEDIQNREGKMEDGQRKKGIAGKGWYDQENEGRFQEGTRTKDRSEMQKTKEIQEEGQRRFRHFLRICAQDEEKEEMEEMEEQAKQGWIRQVVFMWQLTMTWELWSTKKMEPLCSSVVVRKKTPEHL